MGNILYKKCFIDNKNNERHKLLSVNRKKNKKQKKKNNKQWIKFRKNKVRYDVYN